MVKNRLQQICFLIAGLASFSALLVPQAVAAVAAAAPPPPVTLAAGWRLQDVAKVPQSGAQVSSAGFDSGDWYVATVPGTVLTTLVNDHVYPEPLYGENERPEIIPESLVHTSYWYRTVVRIPSSYMNRHIWLNFEGINYSAEVWVNGTQVGTMRGAFIRGIFDVTAQVKPEKRNLIPSVTHVDGSARPQTVERDVNPLYWRLIREFGERTGIPVVMNTSFNLRGEPIVCTPTDAVRTFFSSGMDALVIGSFVVDK